MMPRAARLRSLRRGSPFVAERRLACKPAVLRMLMTLPRKGTTLPTLFRTAPWLGAAALASCLACLPAVADPALPGNAGGVQLAQAPTAQARNAAASKPATQAPGPAGSDSALKQRVDQLEEQLVDMQVVVGTLESLARGGAAPASSGARSDAAAGLGTANDVRIDGLETQVRALTAQIEQLTQQVRALSNAPRRADAAVAPSPAATAAAAAPSAGPDASRFGSTTVTAGTGDAIRGLIDGDMPEPAAAQAPAAAPAPGAQPPGAPPPGAPLPTSETLAAAPPAFMPPPQAGADAESPKQLYETAYGYLMQRDYGAAQAAFEDFLKRYPKDSLAGNAEYWLGEAHFVRGEYKDAAGSFLKGYKNYGGNARAADSLLKLAMSLDRMGQKDAACSSFAELSTRFPDAPDNVKSRAKTERQRIGCR
jgi:tol-pal system protein YbgF